MKEDSLLATACASILILSVLAVLAFMIMNMKPFTHQKRTNAKGTCLTITAKRNIDRISVLAKFGVNEEITFERRRIKKGQSVDFAYPASTIPAKVTVEVESGNVQTLDV